MGSGVEGGAVVRVGLGSGVCVFVGTLVGSEGTAVSTAGTVSGGVAVSSTTAVALIVSVAAALVTGGGSAELQAARTADKTRI
jgi:hypothetical protein